MEIQFTKSLLSEQLLSYSQKSQQLVRCSDPKWGELYLRRRYSLSRLEADLLLDLETTFSKENIPDVFVTELNISNSCSALKQYRTGSKMMELASPSYELQDKKKGIREHKPTPRNPSGWGKIMRCPHYVEIADGFIVEGKIETDSQNNLSSILEKNGYMIR